MLLLCAVNTYSFRALSQPSFPVQNLRTGFVYSSIQAAIDANETINGDSILVREGTYCEEVYIYKSLSLIGANESCTIIDGNSTEWWENVIVTASNVSLTRFTFQNARASGIYMLGSNGLNITHSIIKNCGYQGIAGRLSSNCLISQNDIFGNAEGGIYLARVTNSNLSSNDVFSNDDYGIKLYETSNNLLLNNNIHSNNNSGILMQECSNETVLVNNITDNRDGISIFSSSQVLLARNAVASNDEYGIYQYTSRDISMTESIIEYNMYGIYFDTMNTKNTVLDNKIHSNAKDGIYLTRSSNNSFLSNSVFSNGASGISIILSFDNDCSNNTVFSNGVSGIDLLAGETNRVYGNNVTANYNNGILLDASTNNVLHSNKINSNVQWGVVANFSSNNVIVGNNLSKNQGGGIYLLYSMSNRVSTNSIISGFSGIYADWSDNNSIYCNSISAVEGAGIEVYDSPQNSIYDNLVFSNGFDGIRLQRSDRSFVSQNTVSSNGCYGIAIITSHNNEILQNTVLLNCISIPTYYSGLCFFSSNNNTISGNQISNQTQGVELDYSSYNIFTNNTVSCNEQGIVIYLAESNMFFHNAFLNNSLQVTFHFDLPVYNRWDNGAEGNYWSDYVEKYPAAVELNDSGIWSMPYVIDAANVFQDNYPLVEEWKQTRVFDTLWDGMDYKVIIVSNSTIGSKSYTFNQTLRQISFKITGPITTEGLCNVIIPKELLDAQPGEWIVSIDNHTLSLNANSVAENATHSFICFNFTQGTKTIKIIGTNPIDETPPIADAGANQTVKEDISMVFEGSDSTDNIEISNYTWTFKDKTLQTLTGVSPTYIFSEPGVYEVTLNVTDLRGNWNTSTVTITVLDVTPPIARAKPDRLETVAGSTVVFNAAESSDNVGITSYTWTFMDGTLKTLIGPNPTYKFETPGELMINLTVSDAAGNSNTCTVTVIVAAIPFWTQTWFWWITGIGSTGVCSIAFGLVYYRKSLKQRRLILGYESELQTLPINHPDRARAKFIKDVLEREEKLKNFQRLYGIRLSPATEFDGAASKLGIRGLVEKTRT